MGIQGRLPCYKSTTTAINSNTKAPLRYNEGVKGKSKSRGKNPITFLLTPSNHKNNNSEDSIITSSAGNSHYQTPKIQVNSSKFNTCKVCPNKTK